MRWQAALASVAFLAVSSGAAGVAAPGAWEGTVIHEGRAWRLALRLPAPGLACFDLPDFGIYHRCTSEVDPSNGGARLVYVTSGERVEIAVAPRAGALIGTWQGLGAAGDVELRPAERPLAPIVEEPLRFRSGDLTLAGTLVKPSGAGPFAAVVWVHGSGPQTRHEDFYRDRAYLLAQHGVAALIYDKRGTGESSGSPHATLEELAADAEAAVAALRARPEICTVGLGGFSQGAYVAPLVASRRPGVSFVVAGAVPGVPPRLQNDFAVASALRRAGFDDETVLRAQQLRTRIDAARRSGRGQSEVEAELRSLAAAPWFAKAQLPTPPLAVYSPGELAVLDFDPLPVWAKVDVPVLLLWGELDALVPVAESRRAIAGALFDGANRDATFKIFAGAGHGMLLTTGDEWDWPRLASGFHDGLVSWVLGRALPCGGGAGAETATAVSGR